MIEEKETFLSFEMFDQKNTIISPKIFGHDIHRVIRNEEKMITKIILLKDGVFKEFVLNDEEYALND